MLGKLKPYHNSYGQSCWAAVWLLVCYGVFLKSSFAQDSWQFFRGNRFDGHSDAVGIADRWSEKGPPVFWSRELGSGYSGFVGEDGRVFTQYQSLSGQFVTCLDLKSGATIWEHRYAWPYKPASLYPGPRSTPTLAGGCLFYTTPTAQIGCLNLQNGKLIWERDLGTQFKAPPVEFGYACSPVCADGRVLLPVGGKNASMVALDQLTGEVIWHSGNEAISYCSAYPIEFQGRSLVVGYFKNKLCIYDRSNGNELTQVQVSNDYDEHSAWPIYREPYLWISGPFRAGSKLYRIDQDEGRDTISLRRIDSSSIMSNDVASSVLVDDALYGFDLKDVQSKVHRPSRGRFICIDFLSGDLKWANGSLGRRLQRDEQTVASKQQVNDSDVGHCSVIHADGKLVLFNDTGELILCRV
ncbi:MAG: PQQ-binding-like beta-propeller repeat protein, partial [Planctomycetota bacterium]